MDNKESKTSDVTASKSKTNLNGLIIGLTTLIVLTTWVTLATLYASKEVPTDGHITGYLGTLGDFIGGMMNPILTFITVILLVYTIRQNQEMIKQSQAVIDLNTKELKNSTKELNNSQKALHKDANTNNLKFQFEILKIINDQFEDLLSTIAFKYPTQNCSLRSFLHHIKIGEENFDEQPIIFFNQKVREPGKVYETVNKLILLYETYIESVTTIVSELPATKGHFLQHETTTTIYILNRAIAESDLPISYRQRVAQLAVQTAEILDDYTNNFGLEAEEAE
mgnify:CR=1 FL=1